MKKFLLLFIGVLAVIGLWSGAWLYGAQAIRGQYAMLASPQMPGDPEVSCTDFGIGGYPFWFDINCTGLVLKDGDDTYAMPALRATALAYQPTHLLVVADGPLQYEDAFYGSKREVRWAKLEASARLDDLHIQRISIEADQVDFFDLLVGEQKIGALTHAELHLADGGDFDSKSDRTSLKAFLKLEGLDVAASEMAGRQISGGEGQIDALFTQAPANIFNWGLPNMLRDWQAAGGKLMVNKAEGYDPAASFNLSGELGLDQTGLLEGKFTANSKGIIDDLTQSLPEAMRPLIARKQADGTTIQTLVFTSGLLMAGVVPLGQIPPLY